MLGWRPERVGFAGDLPVGFFFAGKNFLAGKNTCVNRSAKESALSLELLAQAPIWSADRV